MNKRTLISIFIWFLVILIYNEYVITGYANATLNMVVTRPLNVIAVDGNNNRMNITLHIYYPNTNVKYGEQNITGNKTMFISRESYDLQSDAYENKISVLFRGVSLTNLDNLSIGMDKLNAGIEDLITYAVNKDFVMNNATLYLYYDDLKYINESNLIVLKCDEWNFLKRVCNKDFEEINATINTTEKKLTINVNSLSAFAIKDTTIISEGKPEEIFGGGWISPIPVPRIPSKLIEKPKIPEIKLPYLPTINIFLKYPEIRIGLSLLITYISLFIFIYIISIIIHKVFFEKRI